MARLRSQGPSVATVSGSRVGFFLNPAMNSCMSNTTRTPTRICRSPFPHFVLISLTLMTAAAGLAQIPFGPDDVRLTQVLPNGVAGRGVEGNAIAYSETQDLHLVAWVADDEAFSLVPGEDEIFVALFNSTDLTMVSPVFQVSDVGPVMNATFGAFAVDVAWSSLDDSFLVVWGADDATFGSTDNQGEVYGRKVQWTAVAGWTAAPIVKFSDSAGMPADSSRDASDPAVAWGDQQDEWFVVWSSDRQGAGLSDNENEIFGRSVASNGSTLGGTVRLTSMGVPGDPNARALRPDVAYQGSGDRFFVVWQADDVGLDWANQHYEIFGTFVPAALLTDLGGGGPLQLSASGPLLDPDFGAFRPRVAVSEATQGMLVVWDSKFDGAGIDPDKYDIWGIALDDNGTPFIGPVRLGLMGDAGDPDTRGLMPTLDWIPQGDQFLVTWMGNIEVPVSDGGGLDVDIEVWGRSIRTTYPGGVGPLTRISNLGGDAVSPQLYDAEAPAIATGPSGRAVVVWVGDNNEGGQVNTETEVFGEAVLGSWIFVDGFESGTTSAWNN